MASSEVTFASLKIDRRTWRRIVRFATVGILGTGVDVGLFTLLHVALGVAAVPSNIVSYSAGIINNYLLHRGWTYADRPRRKGMGQFGQFVLVSLAALALNTVIVITLSQPLTAALGRPGLGALAAKLCATAVGMIWNYVANSLWTFRHRGAAASTAPEDGDD